jgi:acyl-coenzyme A synthetase/AMP-(fatty) acid ligase
MIGKGSRYENAVPFQPGEDGTAPFRGVRPRAIGPARPVLEHYLRVGERHDLIAAHYYNDPRQWWRVLDANPDVLCAGDLAERNPADPLLVPRARETGAR